VYVSYSTALFSCLKPFEIAQLLISDTRNNLINYSNSDKKSILTFFLDQLTHFKSKSNSTNANLHFILVSNMSLHLIQICCGLILKKIEYTLY